MLRVLAAIVVFTVATPPGSRDTASFASPDFPKVFLDANAKSVLSESDSRTLYAIHGNSGVTVSRDAPKKPEELLAKVTYRPTLSTLGWDYINAETGTAVGSDFGTNVKKLFAVGFLEGYLHHEQIYAFWYNTNGDIEKLSKEKKDEVTEVFLGQDRFMENIENLKNCDSSNYDCRYKQQVFLITTQMHGIKTGYNQKHGKEAVSFNVRHSENECGWWYPRLFNCVFKERNFHVRQLGPIWQFQQT